MFEVYIEEQLGLFPLITAYIHLCRRVPKYRYYSFHFLPENFGIYESQCICVIVNYFKITFEGLIIINLHRSSYN